MTIKDAAVAFLQAAGTKKLTKEIVLALKEGGLKSDAKDWYRTVYNTLTVENKRDGAQIKKAGKYWEVAKS